MNTPNIFQGLKDSTVLKRQRADGPVYQRLKAHMTKDNYSYYKKKDPKYLRRADFAKLYSSKGLKPWVKDDCEGCAKILQIFTKTRTCSSCLSKWRANELKLFKPKPPQEELDNAYNEELKFDDDKVLNYDSDTIAELYYDKY